MMGYTPEDEAVIYDRFKSLLYSCRKVRKSKEDFDLIRKAFFFAKEAHRGVRRKSGEPYLLHPLSVAQIVVDEIGLGTKSVVAALLHDVVEDTDYTVEDMRNMFGDKIATTIDGLTKMSKVFVNGSDAGAGDSASSEQAENFRKVLLTLSDDVRVILIKIADRLHNMRTLASMPPNKQVKITSETIYLFAPLAYRLGLYAIKTELEDLSLKYRFPEQYDEIVRKLNETEAVRSRFIEKFNAPIIEKLKKNDINFTISGRVKSVYSIWSKMQRKQVPFEEIYDLFAIRIVFRPSTELDIPEKTQCWHIYSLITDIYTPKPDRIRDWVNIPKDNGYEALHATVMGPDGIWAEVQIRSERMDDIAERGFAAHWKYKTAEGNDEGEFNKWLRKVREALTSPNASAVEFIDDFKLTLYASEIVVFTPNGESRKLPKGSTALDFAYDIHTNIGHKAIGAKINHKTVSIFALISSGDQIEIITAENSVPKAEWLDHVTTAKAKQSIKNYLKKDRQNNIERGKEIFEKKMDKLDIKPSGRVFRKVLPAYDCSSKDEFYSILGAGIINLDGIEKILRTNSASKILKFWSFQIGNPFKPKSNNGKKAVVVKGREESESSDGPQFEIADCCNPIPGDSIMGYKSPDGKIYVHKSKCDVLTSLAAIHGNDIITIKWSSHKAMSYLSTIEIRGMDRIGIMKEILEVITGQLVNIREVHVQSHDGIFEGKIIVYVKNIDDLNQVTEKISGVKGVDVARRFKG